MMEEVLEMLEGIKPVVAFAEDMGLIDDGLLDSFDIISIVNGLNDAFDIEITVAELLPEHFNDAEAIWHLVQDMRENG